METTVKKRKNIPRIMREAVKDRQKNGCCCCISTTDDKKIFHHIDPVVFLGKNTYYNLVLLCERCHQKLHLGDIETAVTIYEYVYYLYHGKLPEDPYSMETVNSVIKRIKEDYYV